MSIISYFQDKYARMRMRRCARQATSAHDGTLDIYGRKKFYCEAAKKALKNGTALTPLMVASYDKLRIPVERYLLSIVATEHLVQSDFILAGPLHRDNLATWRSHVTDLKKRFLNEKSREQGNFSASLRPKFKNVIATPTSTKDDFITAQKEFIDQLTNNWSDSFNRYRSTPEGIAVLKRLRGERA